MAAAGEGEGSSGGGGYREGSSGGGCCRGRGSPATAVEGVAAVAEEGCGGGKMERGGGQKLTFYTRLLGFGGDSCFLDHDPTILAQLYRIN
jgi:hypothetical protein